MHLLYGVGNVVFDAAHSATHLMFIVVALYLHGKDVYAIRAHTHTHSGRQCTLGGASTHKELMNSRDSRPRLSLQV